MAVASRESGVRGPQDRRRFGRLPSVFLTPGPRLLTPCCPRRRLISLRYTKRGPVMADQKLILIVDDDRELVEGVRAVLERQGFKVIQAHDGHQGKQAIYNQKPDLV